MRVLMQICHRNRVFARTWHTRSTVKSRVNQIAREHQEVRRLLLKKRRLQEQVQILESQEIARRQKRNSNALRETKERARQLRVAFEAYEDLVARVRVAARTHGEQVQVVAAGTSAPRKQDSEEVSGVAPLLAQKSSEALPVHSAPKAWARRVDRGQESARLEERRRHLFRQRYGPSSRRRPGTFLAVRFRAALRSLLVTFGRGGELWESHLLALAQHIGVMPGHLSRRQVVRLLRELGGGATPHGTVAGVDGLAAFLSAAANVVVQADQRALVRLVAADQVAHARAEGRMMGAGEVSLSDQKALVFITMLDPQGKFFPDAQHVLRERFHKGHIYLARTPV